MATPNPLEPVKGAGTTLWVYIGTGDAYANPLSDDDWQRLAKVTDLTPGEMTAESYDDNYLDDEEAVTNGAIVIHTQRLKSDPGGNLLS